MPAAGTLIHALDEKLKVLFISLARKEVLRAATLRELCDATGINYQTLKSAKAKKTLTDELIIKLSTFAGFDPDDSRWYDPSVSYQLRSLPDASYPGRDTVAAFRALMHQVLELGGTHVQLRTTELDHLDTRLAKFQMDCSGQNFEEGQSAELLLTTHLETSEEGGVQFGFKQVRVEMTLPAAQRVTVQRRLGHNRPYAIKDATLSSLAGNLNPEWHLRANADVLMGEYATRDTALALLTNLNVGDRIAAKLSAKVRGGDLKVISGDTALSPNQEVVIRALFERQLTGAKDGGGWVTLARQTLQVRRGDD